MTLCGAAEPAPFNHQKHAPLKLRCVSCHTNALGEERAGFPALKQCQVCHLELMERTIPLLRVYEVPDFVFFSHAKHAGAKIECKVCHGDVTVMASVAVQQAVKMKWCVDCHKTTKAAVGCNTCHELGQ